MLVTMAVLIMQVNCQAGGQTALHIAIVRGFYSVLKVLLQFNPKLDIKVDLAAQNDTTIA